VCGGKLSFDIDKNVFQRRFFGSKAHFCTEDSFIQGGAGGGGAFHNLKEVFHQFFITAEMTAAEIKVNGFADLFHVMENMDNTGYEIELDGAKVADQSGTALAGAVSGDKVLGICHMQSVFIFDQGAAAVLISGVFCKAAVFTNGKAVMVFADVFRAFGAGFGIGTIGTFQAGFFVSLKNLLGFHAADSDGLQAVQQIVDVIQVMGGFLQKQTAGLVFVPIPFVVVAPGVVDIIISLHL